MPEHNESNNTQLQLENCLGKKGSRITTLLSPM